MKNKTIAGIGLADLLLIAFVVLKLTGVITWSWVWVLAPLWIPLILCIVFWAWFFRTFG